MWASQDFVGFQSLSNNFNLSIHSERMSSLSYSGTLIKALLLPICVLFKHRIEKHNWSLPMVIMKILIWSLSLILFKILPLMSVQFCWVFYEIRRKIFDKHSLSQGRVYLLTIYSNPNWKISLSGSTVVVIFPDIHNHINNFWPDITPVKPGLQITRWLTLIHIKIQG